MALATKQTTMSVEEFLDWHELQEQRYELIDGVPVPLYKSVGPDGRMMAGAGRPHVQVTTNAIASLHRNLTGKTCQPYGSDAAVRTSPTQIRYPDVVVDCTENPDDSRIFQTPIVIIEVISPTNRPMEMVRKMKEYWDIPSVRDILLIDPATLTVDVHSRSDECGSITLERFEGREGTIQLSSIDANVLMSDLFERVAEPSNK